MFDKRSSGSAIKNEMMSNQQLAEESHKTVIRKFEKHKIYSSFKDNVWVADLADIRLMNKHDRFSLRVIDIYSKFAWAVPLKDKKVIKITNVCQKVLNEPVGKPSSMWVDESR